jgi:light-independent protochlorophyllide reductase subunit B
MPMVKTVPIGIGATRDFIREVGEIAGIDVARLLDGAQSRLPWYSRSVDSTYLTGKRVFIFADGTHAIAAARIAKEELGFDVVGLGTYAREMARDVRAAATALGLEALISDDYLEVEAKIADAAPELVLGTQMERHIAKRLGVPCAVISGPFHVQDVPARHSPQMGWEGANVIFDTWVHPLMMGLEEHLLTMFREDFEFHDDAAASHLPVSARAGDTPQRAAAATAITEAADAVSAMTAPTASAAVAVLDEPSAERAAEPAALQWTKDGEKELGKIPFFVRGKARRNTEKYATEHGINPITVDTLYEAKAHFGK